MSLPLNSRRHGVNSSYLYQTKFLLAFEHGDRAGFFNLWDQHLPLPLKNGDPTCQSLEFNVSVHFAVYPVRAGTGSGAQAVQDFKSYLENRGAVLAQSQEFAMFCALPYVPDPSKHPTFKTIFTVKDNLTFMMNTQWLIYPPPSFLVDSLFRTCGSLS